MEHALRRARHRGGQRPAHRALRAAFRRRALFPATRDHEAPALRRSSHHRRRTPHRGSTSFSMPPTSRSWSRALVAPAPPRALLVAIAVLVPVLGVLDKTLFLCARGEHYWTTIVVFVLASDFVPGAKAFTRRSGSGRAFSKLNHHFPAVVGVMTSNSPFTRFRVDASGSCTGTIPDDLGPSRASPSMRRTPARSSSSRVPIVLLCGRRRRRDDGRSRAHARSCTASSPATCRWACRSSGT